MKDLWAVLRIALAVLALPLAATAAVSALSDRGESISENVLAVRAAHAMKSASFRNHSVFVDDSGVVRGRVVSTAGDTVTGLDEMKIFFVRDGEIATNVYSRPDGSFEATGLEEGNYSFVATGANGFGAFGLRVVKGENSQTNNLIEVGTVSPKFERLTEIIGDRLPAEVVSEIEADALVAVSSPAPGANRVQVVDGKVSGTLASLTGNVDGAEVHLIRDQEKIAEVATDSEGKFELDGIEPGVYEFVAFSPSGMAAISFEAVAQDETTVVEPMLSATELAAATGEGSEVLSQEIISQDAGSSVVAPGVGFDNGYAASSLDVCTTCGTDGLIVGEQFDYACDSCGLNAPYTDPYAYPGTQISTGAAAGGCCGSAGNWGGFAGGCGGGCGGGGAGFGGLGGLAGLGRLAILGWVLTELFDEIDFSNNNNNLPPVSPSA